MRNFLTTAAVSLALALVGYLLCAFITMEWNPAAWSYISRFILVAMWAWATTIAVIVRGEGG